MRILSDGPIPTDPESLRSWRDRTLFRLLHRATRSEQAETAARVRQRGHPRVNLSYATVLSNLDTTGTTISDLARRVGITRQAASQQLAVIERTGYVRRVADPADSRVVLVQSTAKGERLLRTALQVVAELEAEYAQSLGAPNFERLKALLIELVDQIDPGGWLEER